MDYLSKIEELLSFGGRSRNTIVSYKTYTAPFFDYCVNMLHKDPTEANPSEIRAFLLWLKAERSLSDASINHAISEIRFFYESVLGQPWNGRQIPHRRLKRFLPYVPDKDAVSTFIRSIGDIKKKAMVFLMYSAGLRISEVCSLKCSDIQGGARRIYVAPSKNGRDRYAILSENALRIVRDYWRSLPPHLKTRDWLFTQQTNVKKPIYPQFIQSFIPAHEASLGWPHRMTPHTFRHAYATHSFMDGMDLNTLSLLMGHASADSTRIYVHLATLGLEIGRFKSPADGMEV